MFTKSIKLSHLALVLLLVGSPLLASAQGKDPVPERREITQPELDRRFDLARSLTQEGKFEQALKEYLFVFDNSRGVSGYAGVRLSYVPGEIAAMGRVYPPALVALKTRRDEREKLVLAGKADFDVVHELTSFNQYLVEPERNLSLFDKLKTMGPAYAAVREDLTRLVWEQLVEAKRYGDLKDNVDKLARRVVEQIAERVIGDDFPGDDFLSSPEYQKYLRDRVINDGGKVYETLLALDKTEKAAKLAKWMLTFSADGEMYAQLIKSAINVKRTDIADDLLGRANKTLKRGEDLRLVRQAANQLPRAN